MLSFLRQFVGRVGRGLRPRGDERGNILDNISRKIHLELVEIIFPVLGKQLEELMTSLCMIEEGGGIRR
jgi:hypothetical protein